jgi:hypothetical protein
MSASNRKRRCDALNAGIDKCTNLYRAGLHMQRMLWDARILNVDPLLDCGVHRVFYTSIFTRTDRHPS